MLYDRTVPAKTTQIPNRIIFMLTESRSRNQLLQKAYFLSAVQLSDYKQRLIGQVNIGQFWFKSAKLSH